MQEEADSPPHPSNADDNNADNDDTDNNAADDNTADDTAAMQTMDDNVNNNAAMQTMVAMQMTTMQPQTTTQTMKPRRKQQRC
jgi:hypothetical protein